MKKIKSLKDEYRNSNLYKCIEPWETPEEAEGFFLTPFNPKETGLAMCVNLRCLENKGEPPFLRFQNDRETKPNLNWVKMYLDGTLDNYENKEIIFSKEEMQLLQKWITLNKNVITKHYYQEYDSYDVCRRLKNIDSVKGKV